MLKLATLIDNPGEPAVASRYRDPHELRRLGYNGIVIYETTALSGVASPQAAGDEEMRRWLGHHVEDIRQRIEHARGAGLAVYVFYDTLCLPRTEVERHVLHLACKNRPTMLCPASDLALDKSVAALEALLAQLGEVDGVVLRYGDNDAARLPHLVGNDLLTPHCPRCSQLGRADRIVRFAQRFHDLVVTRLNKRLILRAWNVRPNGMHDSVELATRICERLPGGDRPDDDRFVLSFKFTHSDFWRYQRWNPASLACGRRPIVYELQCQREFEGKGGIPNWQAPLWRDGPSPAEWPSGGAPAGLAQVAAAVNLAGLWAWVRGGGWGGPFVKNETWIDANVFAVPHLADNPSADVEALARQWVADRLELTGDAAAAVHALLRDSTEFVRQAFYIGPFARRRSTPWHPNADWIQDDLIDAAAASRMIERLSDDELDQVVQEKQDAVDALARDHSALYHHVNEQNRKTLEPLINSLVYAESLFEALRDLLGGLVAYRRYLRSRDPAMAEITRRRLLAAQSHWNHHTQRHGALRGAATAFREVHFWELTQQILQDVAAVTA